METATMINDSMVVEQRPATRLRKSKPALPAPLVPEGYITVEEFRKWGHEMVNRKFKKT